MFFFFLFQNPLVWRNFSLKTGRRRWNGSTPVNCWQKSKVGLSGTQQIYHTNTALSHVNKSLIPIRHILSMCCIISETVLYSGIKQRPLAALLLHFSALLSGNGMLHSLQSAVLKIPTNSETLCLSALHCCHLFRRPSVLHLVHVQHVHAAMVIAMPKVRSL